MKKKYIVIASIIALLIIGIFIVSKVSIDLNRENKIKNEVKEIIQIIESDNIDKAELIEILDRRVVTKGDYNLVETSIKAYYKDLYDDISNLSFLLDDDNFSNYLTASNLKEDRPSFIKSKDNLQNSKAQITEVYNELNNQLTDKTTIMTYIADKEVSTYYKDFYYSLVYDYITEEYQETITTKKDNTLSKIDVYNEALEFLIANKGHWDLSKEVIMFDETTLYEEYLSITDKLKEVSEN